MTVRADSLSLGIAEWRAGQLGMFTRLANPVGQEADILAFADHYGVDAISIPAALATELSAQRVRHRIYETGVRSGYLPADPELYDLAIELSKAELSDAARRKAMNYALSEAAVAFRRAAPADYARAQAAYDAARMAYDSISTGEVSSDAQRAAAKFALSEAEKRLAVATPEYYAKAKAVYETAHSLYTKKMSVRQAAFTAGYTVCLAKGGSPEACRDGIEAILDFLDGNISEKELTRRSGSLVGAVAAVAACSAVGLAVAAPLCAWAGSIIGGYAGEVAAEVNGWIKDGVLSNIPGFTELDGFGRKVLSEGWEALKDLGESIIDIFS